jgi:protein N-lysine methyltransferase METTL21D
VTLPSEKTDNFRGLGHLDSHKDVLQLVFEVKPPGVSTSQAAIGTKRRRKEGGKSSGRAGRAPTEDDGRVIEISLAQDKTALRSRKGDTGSVVWKARQVRSRSG